MLKILQARLQQYMNHKLPDVQAGFRKSRGNQEGMIRTQRTLHKDLNELDNHNGVVTHPEPDILECEVKCILGITTANKASGDDDIPAEVFKILKDDSVKVLYSIFQQV